MDLFEAIQHHLFRERVLHPVSIFDNFFDKEAIEKRKQQQQPTDAEELARQHRSDVLLHLTDFSSVWPRAEIVEYEPGKYMGGVNNVVTPSDLVEQRKANQTKDAAVLSGNGWTLTFDGETVTLRTPNGIVQLSSQQYEEIRSAISNLSTVPPLNDAYGYAGGSQVVTSSSHVPARKSQAELVGDLYGTAKQNEERLDHWVKVANQTGNWGTRKGD
jgi:hypothetical protein